MSTGINIAQLSVSKINFFSDQPDVCECTVEV